MIIREKIDIIHGHGANSNMSNVFLLHAQNMNVRTIFTDHSQFGFADIACVNMNKGLKWVLNSVDGIISVSNTNKENICLRAFLEPKKCYVIPNAVDGTRFTPNPGLRFPINTINIVIVSRITYRKGIDLLIDIIPPIVKKYP